VILIKCSSSDSENSIIAAVSKTVSKSKIIPKKKVLASSKASSVLTRKQNKNKAVQVNTKKRLFSDTNPSYNHPMMKNWEDCNDRMHCIFGYNNKDFSSTEAKSTLLEKIEYMYNCPPTFVGSFLTKLIEIVKELMANEVENKMKYEQWDEKIDKVRDEINK
jgi:hypothetical protein